MPDQTITLASLAGDAFDRFERRTRDLARSSSPVLRSLVDHLEAE